MRDTYFLQVTQQALLLVLVVSAPAVFVSLGVGLAVSLFQAVTQIQDHTLSFVPKLVAVALTLLVAGGWMGAQLTHFAARIFGGIALLR